ncbi:MAG: MFS transporter [Deinococcales bacterium]
MDPLTAPDPPPDPPPAAPDPVRRTMRVSVVEGSVTQVFLNWTSGAVLVGFMLHLGANATDIALVASVPLLAQAASPLAALAADLLGRRRLLTALVAILGRGVWALAALLPSLGLPAAELPGLMVLLVLTSSVFQASNGTLWSAWMGDVVPEKQRGRYFGFRAGVVGVVGMLANLAAGWFLDRVAAPASFQVVFVVAVLSAGVGVALYFRQYDPPSPRRRTALRDVLVTPLRDANFRRFLLFAVYWQFVVLLAAPFVIPYFLEQLKLTFTQVAIWSAVAALTALLTSSLWGRVADRVGRGSRGLHRDVRAGGGPGGLPGRRAVGPAAHAAAGRAAPPVRAHLDGLPLAVPDLGAGSQPGLAPAPARAGGGGVAHPRPPPRDADGLASHRLPLALSAGPTRARPAGGVRRVGSGPRRAARGWRPDACDA